MLFVCPGSSMVSNLGSRRFFSSTSVLKKPGLKNRIFNIRNKSKFWIGLTASIIVAGLGFGFRYVISSYWGIGVFSTSENTWLSLLYFCKMGGGRFLIKEWL